MFGVDDAVLAAGISAAGQAIGAGASAAAAGKLNKKTMAFNREEAEKQRQWNEAMADKQNAWNYEMWLKQNEYNTPEAQVDRLRAAGLNPLYFGLDGSSAGEVTAAQPLAYERASVDNLANPVASGLSAAAQIAQISNLQAQTAKTGQETLTEVQKREKVQAEILTARQELNNMLAQEGLTKAQTDEINRGLDWLDRMNQSLLDMRESEIKLNDAQRERIQKLVDGEQLIQAKTLEDFEYKWRKVESEIKKMASETGLNYLDIENYALNHTSNGFMGTGLSVQNFIRLIKESFSRKIRKSPDESDSDVFQADATSNIVDNKY